MVTLIVPERPDSVDATALISELHGYVEPLAPKESRHGFSVEKLVDEDVAFFVMRHDLIPAGCGGVKPFDNQFSEEYGEIKRMYVRPAFHGSGLGRLMLEHLVDYTQRQKLGVLRLETGVYLTEAIGLYERFGFQRIPSFGDYKQDPLSLYFEKQLT